MLEKSQLPRHVGIIMDGNRRWAKLHRLPRLAGHGAGAKTFRAVVEYCAGIGIPYLTVYAFSTENWRRRSEEEVRGMIGLFRQYLLQLSSCAGSQVRVKFFGDLSPFGEEIQTLARDCEENTRQSTGLQLNIMVNYGGKSEIVQGVQRFCADVQAGKVRADELSEQLFSQYLDTGGLPDVDLVIRSSGEYRLSNFLTWQSAYAEYVVDRTLWPDFSEKTMEAALKEFAGRQNHH